MPFLVSLPCATGGEECRTSCEADWHTVMGLQPAAHGPKPAPQSIRFLSHQVQMEHTQRCTGHASHTVCTFGTGSLEHNPAFPSHEKNPTKDQVCAPRATSPTGNALWHVIA
uniref:Uncharacterized protein n=1 Tax=Eutreptiella gymnastica TaxID=73025 RepID=A0A7S4FXW4_9EUGL